MSHPFLFGSNAALNGDGALPDGDNISPNGDAGQPFSVQSAIGDIAGRLKSLRENELGGLAVAKVGKKLAAMGVENASGSSVNRYELGKRKPPVDYVLGIAQLAGVSWESVMFAEGPPPSMKEMRADYIARVITGDLDDAVVAEIGPKGRMRKATGKAGMRPGKRKVKAKKGAED